MFAISCLYIINLKRKTPQLRNENNTTNQNNSIWIALFTPESSFFFHISSISVFVFIFMQIVQLSEAQSSLQNYVNIYSVSEYCHVIQSHFFIYMLYNVDKKKNITITNFWWNIYICAAWKNLIWYKSHSKYSFQH